MHCCIKSTIPIETHSTLDVQRRRSAENFFLIKFEFSVFQSKFSMMKGKFLDVSEGFGRQPVDKPKESTVNMYARPGIITAVCLPNPTPALKLEFINFCIDSYKLNHIQVKMIQIWI